MRAFGELTSSVVGFEAAQVEQQRVVRAHALVEQIAARAGAGATLRTGVHLLRWRLCAASGRDDCGPVWPPWAQEELFEQRIAREAAAG